MKRPLILAIVGIAVIGAFAAWMWNKDADLGPTITVADALDPAIDTSSVLEMSLGNPDAKVTVIEYASFTCPHCRNFHATVMKALQENYIDTGKINFVYREVYFDRYGLWGGIVARCGGPDRYFGITNLLYEQQNQWTASKNATVIAGNLRTIGKTAGLTDEDLNACFNDGDKAAAMVALYQRNAEADDVNSTPTFIINGEKFGNMNYDDFAAVIEAKLAE